MRSPSSGWIPKLLGALLPCAYALRSRVPTSPTHTVDLPWDARPKASKKSQWCLLTPTYSHDFRNARNLLQSILTHAVDTVPLFVILASDKEAETWRNLSSARAGTLAPHRAISLEEALRAGSLGEAARAKANFSGVLDSIMHAEKFHCDLGTADTRSIGGLKKLYGARHLGKAYGCDVVWAMDCDSQPMRNFSFSEAFSRLGKVWVGDGALRRWAKKSGNLIAGLSANTRCSKPCSGNAERIHRLALDPKVRNMELRQNDFWLYETRLLSRMMDDAASGLGAGSTGGFLEAWLQGGQVSEQILWTSWLAQNVRNGKLQGADSANYSLVTVPETSPELSLCFNPTTPTVSLALETGDLLLEAGRHQQFSWSSFGRYWFDTLGQAGILGNYLFQYPMENRSLKEFVAAVPWCLSNCHTPKVQKQIDSLRAA